MKRIALVAALAASTQLAGCWFVFIPGSLITQATDAITGKEGNNCVPRDAAVGQLFRGPGGRLVQVVKLEGETSRCPAETPIRALVK